MADQEKKKSSLADEVKQFLRRCADDIDRELSMIQKIADASAHGHYHPHVVGLKQVGDDLANFASTGQVPEKPVPPPAAASPAGQDPNCTDGRPAARTLPGAVGPGASHDGPQVPPAGAPAEAVQADPKPSATAKDK